MTLGRALRDATIWGWIALCVVLSGCGITITRGADAVTLNPGQIPQRNTVQYADATKVGVHVEAGGYGADIGYIKTRVTTVPLCPLDAPCFVPSVRSSVAIGVDLGGSNTVSDELLVGSPKAAP